MIDWMDGLDPVTEAPERARLARWAVSLRRAHAAGIPQATGALARIERLMDFDTEEPAQETAAYCCLGIWCEIEHAAGRLERKDDAISTELAFCDSQSWWNSSTLPWTARLNGHDNPDLLRIVSRSEVGDGTLEELARTHGYWADVDETTPDVEHFVDHEARTYCAADLNDDLELPFAEIADVIIWRYGLTAQELAIAEAEPRVPAVEGPEPKAS